MSLSENIMPSNVKEPHIYPQQKQWRIPENKNLYKTKIIL